MSLNDNELKYLQERGFELIKRSPRRNDVFPYLCLNSPQDESDMYYHYNEIGGAMFLRKINPSNVKTSELVEAVELMVAGAMDFDGFIFTTQPGQKIKIFMTD
nr:hypothetical protein [Nanoarchaeum sp.]